MKNFQLFLGTNIFVKLFAIPFVLLLIVIIHPLTKTIAQQKKSISDEPHRFKVSSEEVILCVAFSPNNNKVAAGTMGGSILLWDVDTDTEPIKFIAIPSSLLSSGVLSLSFSPDGRRILAGGANNSVQLWDVAAKKRIYNLKGHGGPVWSVAFFRNGRRALSGSTDDNTIREWNLDNGTELRLFQGNERADSLSISPDEQSFATTSFNTIQIWDLKSGKVSRSLVGHKYRVLKAFFFPDGRRILSGNLGEAWIWNARSGEVLQKFEAEDLLKIESLSVSSDGEYVLLGGIGKMQLWSVKTGKPIKQINDLSGEVAVAFSPDGRFALSGEMWGRVSLWKLLNSK